MIPMKSPPPPRPGELLRERLEALPYATQDMHASRMGISRRRLNEIMCQDRAVTTDTALRLGRYLGTPPEYWLQAQMRWDLHQTRGERKLMREIDRIAPAMRGAHEPRGVDALMGSLPERPEPLPELDVVKSLRSTLAGQAQVLREHRYLREFLEKQGLLGKAERYARTRAELELLDEEVAPEEIPDARALLRRRA